MVAVSALTAAIAAPAVVGLTAATANAKPDRCAAIYQAMSDSLDLAQAAHTAGDAAGEKEWTDTYYGRHGITPGCAGDDEMSTTGHAAATDADRALKAKHRGLWASGNYPAVAAERGVELEWLEADAEALPFADDSFDVVMSCVGAMFTPHHQATADELLRVCRPEGTIGLINWTPEGFIGQLLATMKPYAPPPPPGTNSPPLWGDEAHVRELFGERVIGLRMRRHAIVMNHCVNPLDFREYWKCNYGPTIAVYRFNEDRPERLDELDRDFLAFLTNWNRAVDAGHTAYDAEYLLVTATKRQLLDVAKVRVAPATRRAGWHYARARDDPSGLTVVT